MNFLKSEFTLLTINFQCNNRLLPFDNTEKIQEDINKPNSEQQRIFIFISLVNAISEQISSLLYSVISSSIG